MILGNTDVKIPTGSIALVTGGTGFTGSVLIRELLSRGVKVRAIRRGTTCPPMLENLTVDWYHGNVYDPEIVKRAADGVHYIFHLAAAYRQAKIADEEYSLVHVKSTKLLAEAALQNKSLRRFVHVSTIGVHGHIDTPPADENSRFAPGDIYQRTKAEAELWFIDFAKNNNLPFAIVRPTAIYGPRDARLFKVFRMASWKVFPILGFGKCLYHLIHVDDLANGIILAATHPNAEGEIFICGNKEAIRLVDIARIVAEELGSKFFVLRIPAWPFFALGYICEAICRPLGIEPIIYPRRVAFYTKDRCFNTKKIHELIGFNETFSNESGIKATTKWYVENGWLRSRHTQGPTASKLPGKSDQIQRDCVGI